MVKDPENDYEEFEEFDDFNLEFDKDDTAFKEEIDGEFFDLEDEGELEDEDFANYELEDIDEDDFEDDDFEAYNDELD
ncbi:hypothetical protein QWY93_17805 [Echinicola jeungdonensis]|uniref:Uncharacterized protein n=1 Tax=Echinicola jeungdonensis TaxID=709343 RepID=A0ABV5J1N9_9BACT|nr:hypothetical protein [Echinicola jeungdonensis]MDN3671172.1 hypothetical protein [Echinicola jeungdonensis]